MQKEDILKLASLARIAIDEKEVEKLRDDIESVLAYVSEINAITADVNITKTVGVRYNIFREDTVTNEGGQYTEALLGEAPKVQGRHFLVKKILQQD